MKTEDKRTSVGVAHVCSCCISLVCMAQMGAIAAAGGAVMGTMGAAATSGSVPLITSVFHSIGLGVLLTLAASFKFKKRNNFSKCRKGGDETDIWKGWPKSEEHVEAYYFPFTERGISEYVMMFHPELMRPTSAVITYSLIDFGTGRKGIAELTREISKHPLYSRIHSKTPMHATV